MIDTDPQQSLRDWWEAREAESPYMLDVDVNPKQLAASLKKARANFDWIFVDTPPAAPVWLVDALKAADLALIPCRPSPDDLRAVGKTLDAVEKAGVNRPQFAGGSKVSMDGVNGKK